ncbi:hypothetical protein [Chryseobacterium sp.]|uniref:hypothetical protein n=1 Tax=Chryseobacterium sp. TaxID=1871047 RepID=UPI00289AD5D7|nr:hypothetical protein [Chryseobacterium sp.]
MSVSLSTIFSWFETGDVPTQDQFQQTFSSFLHKEEDIPMTKITGLNNAFSNTVSTSTFNLHLTDSNAHKTTLAMLNASNLNEDNKAAWRSILGIGNVPDNVGLVDEGVQQSVYNKDQVSEMFMMLEDFTIDGQIRADKIEALGITDLIQATENSIAQFAANNSHYEFQNNDFIAIPAASGSYNLYLYKGGQKDVVANYLPTGLTNITIGMVEGLSVELNKKIDGPESDGSYFTRRFQGVRSQRLISPSISYLTYWNGNDLVGSSMYTDGAKFGVATTTPTEMLHLNNGRLRSKGVVLDDNSETVNNQLSQTGRKLYFTNSVALKTEVLMKENLLTEYLSLPTALTVAQKEQFATAWNNQYSNGQINVYSISPAIIKNDHIVRYLVLQGLNLNLNPSTTSVKFIPVANTLGLGEINCLGFQPSADGTSLMVSIYGDSLQAGIQYNIVIRTTTPTQQTHRTQSNVNVVTNINSIDTSSLGWTKIAYTPNQADVILSTNGSLFGYSSNANNKAYAYEPNTFVGAIKSNPLFPEGSNFYLEMNVSVSFTHVNAVTDVYDFYGYLGLIQSNIGLVLNDNSFIRVINSTFRSGTYYAPVQWNNLSTIANKIESGQTVLQNANIVIMRQGNVYTQLITAAGKTISQTIVATTDAVSLSLAVTNGTGSKNINASIVQAFTF